MSDSHTHHPPPPTAVEQHFPPPTNPQQQRKRRLKVSFGNPALGTYNGYVYILDSNENYEGDERGEELRNVVAMMDVPPDQVPEGVLTFSRAYTLFIRHVRIVIEEEVEEENTEVEEDAAMAESRLQAPYELTKQSSSSIENAASILAAGEERSISQLASDPSTTISNANTPPNHHSQSNKKYLVLFEMTSSKQASNFVQDLNNQPYTSFEPDVVCIVKRVVRLEGGDGVSLLSPFFACDSAAAASAKAENDSSIGAVAAAGGGGVSADGNVVPPATGMSAAVASSSPAAVVAEVHNCAVCLEKMDLLEAAATNHTAAAASSLPSSSTSPTLSSLATSSRHTKTPSPIPPSASSTNSQYSIITTVCNHTFHIDCLLQWSDSPCPVCRYDHSGLNEALSMCHVCGTTEHNYVCLICGVVSCGGGGGVGAAASEDGRSAGVGIDAVDESARERMDGPVCHHQAERGGSVAAAASAATSTSTRGNGLCQANSNNDEWTEIASSPSTSQMPPTQAVMGHAKQHYDETLHAYALDTSTQHVWDFAGQGYVHRLIQNDEDGKLVEVNDPQNTTRNERSTQPSYLSDAQEGEVVHRKLEGFASQYYTLLKSQMEQQRIYYLGKLEEIRREHGVAAGTGAVEEVKEENVSTSRASSSSTKHHSKKRTKTPPPPERTISKTESLIAALKAERRQLEQRCLTLKRKYKKVSEETDFLIEMNTSLEKNKHLMKLSILEARKDQDDAREMMKKMLPKLEEKVRVLMLQLENGGSGGGKEEEKVMDGVSRDDRKPAARRK